MAEQHTPLQHLAVRPGACGFSPRPCSLHSPSSHHLTSQKEGIKWGRSGGGTDFCSYGMFRNSFLGKVVLHEWDLLHRSYLGF